MGKLADKLEDKVAGKLDDLGLVHSSHKGEKWLGLPPWTEYEANHNNDGRFMRENFNDEDKATYFNDMCKWHLATTDLESKITSKGGVYEWACRAPSGKKHVCLYLGKAKSLQSRLKHYIHPDGVYPSGEQQKTLMYGDLQDRGFDIFVRWKVVTGCLPKVEESKGLTVLDYAFNRMEHGGYREPVLPGPKRVLDYRPAGRSPVYQLQMKDLARTMGDKVRDAILTVFDLPDDPDSDPDE
eukprot:gene12286-341_t